MNEFEKYIAANKEKLEPQEVNPKVWLSIENKMLKKQHARSRFYIKALAAAAVVLIGMYASYVYMNPKTESIEAQLIERYQLSEYNFPQQVSMKEKQLEKITIPKDKLEDFQILLQQLEFLDGQFQDYTQYIEKNGYQEFIGNQILIHYKSKIKLLDRIQKEIEKINYYESKVPSNNEKIEINI